MRVSLSVRETGSAAARGEESAAGEAGEPSDGGRSCIGASAVGAVGGGIHRCGSLRADDCGLIDRRRAVFSWDVLRLNSANGRHERLIRVEEKKDATFTFPYVFGPPPSGCSILSSLSCLGGAAGCG